jgi:anti-anti-sigma factor
MESMLRLDTRAGKHQGTSVMHVEGPLSLETVPQFLKAVRSETAPLLILDLQGVAFIDSAGVGAMVQTLAHLQKSARQMALVGVGPKVQAVFEITRVQRIFSFFPTAQEAEEQLADTDF